MNYLITPITLSDGLAYCVDPATKRTEVIYGEDAGPRIVSPFGWTLYQTDTLTVDRDANPTADSDRSYSGWMEFAVGCGVTSVVLQLEGWMETKDNDYDWLLIKLNGLIIFRIDSTRVVYAGPSPDLYLEVNGDYTDPYETVHYDEPYTIIIPADRPCGNIIRVEADTNDVTANNGVSWSASITSIA